MTRCKEQTRQTEGRRIREMLGMPRKTTRQVAKELGLNHPQKVLRLEEQALEKVARGIRQLAKHPQLVLPDSPTEEEQPLVLAEIIRQLEAELKFNSR